MNQKIFISYNHSDKNRIAARNVAKTLEDMGVKVWLDQDEMSIGDSISEAIQRGLDSSSHVVVLVAPEDRASDWAKFELKSAIKSGKRVLPVLVENATPQDLPDIISDRLAVDASDDLLNLKKIYDTVDADSSFWVKLREYLTNG